MAEKIVMLALSPTMETGKIASWHKKEGDTIDSGDILCEVETDKATMDYESIQEGALLKIIAGDGARVKVGDTIAISGEPGEDIESLIEEVKKESKEKKPAKPAEAEKQAKEMPRTEGTRTEEQPQAKSEEGHLPGGVKASPLAREMAKRKGIDLKAVHGTGPDGRIVKADIESYKKAAPAPTAQRAYAMPSAQALVQEEISVSEKRRIIAQRLSQSMYSSPHYYVTIVAKMDDLLAARKSLNTTSAQKVSFNAFLIKLVAETIKRYPMVNATWKGDTIVKYGAVDIGLAVAQEDGLITPIVRNCTAKGIVQIDQELRALVVKARNGALTPKEYNGATFTISNLGSYGVRDFTAIINPPASAILAVGEIYKEPVVIDDKVAIQSSMHTTLSCDHRVIDGAVAAEFLRDLKKVLEQPIHALY